RLTVDLVFHFREGVVKVADASADRGFEAAVRIGRVRHKTKFNRHIDIVRNELRLALAGDGRFRRQQEAHGAIGVVEAQGGVVTEFISFEAKAYSGNKTELRLGNPKGVRIVNIDGA